MRQATRRVGIAVLLAAMLLFAAWRAADAALQAEAAAPDQQSAGQEIWQAPDKGLDGVLPAAALSEKIVAVIDGRPVTAAQQRAEEAGKEEERQKGEEAAQEAPHAVGSLKLQLSAGGDGTKPSGVTFHLMQAAALVGDRYVVTDAFRGAAVDFDALTSAAAAEEAAGQLLAVYRGGSDRTSVTDARGTAVFTQLEEGIYLFYADPCATYDAITPSLLSVPAWDADAEKLAYDQEAEPKHTARPTPSAAPQVSAKPSASPAARQTAAHAGGGYQTGYDNHLRSYFAAAVVLGLAALLWRRLDKLEMRDGKRR